MREFSNQQEKMIANFLNWSVVKGSGAVACYPGDVQSPKWLGECKTHAKAVSKVTFKKAVWKKICDEAAAKFRYPILFVDSGTQRVDDVWCLFPAYVLDPTTFKNQFIFVYDDSIECTHYTFPIKQNIQLDPYLMKETYCSRDNNRLERCMFRTTFDSMPCMLCKLTVFQKLSNFYGWYL